MSKVIISYLEIDENFYIENDIAKVKINESDMPINLECSIENIWHNVKKIIMKVKEYEEQNKFSSHEELDKFHHTSDDMEFIKC